MTAQVLQRQARLMRQRVGRAHPEIHRTAIERLRHELACAWQHGKGKVVVARHQALVAQLVVGLPIRHAHVRPDGAEAFQEVGSQGTHHPKRAPQAQLLGLLPAQALERLMHEAQVAACDLGELVQLMRIGRRRGHPRGVGLEKRDAQLLLQRAYRLGKALRRDGHEARRCRVVALLVGQLEIPQLLAVHAFPLTAMPRAPCPHAARFHDHTRDALPHPRCARAERARRARLHLRRRALLRPRRACAEPLSICCAPCPHAADGRAPARMSAPLTCAHHVPSRVTPKRAPARAHP